MNIIPLGSRVLLERLPVEEHVTDSGVILPAQGGAPTYKNKVVALGSDVSKPITVGDTVITTPLMGEEIRTGNDTFYLLHEDDLLAVLAV